MKDNYTKTPSFYNNEDFFNKYLGKTSYYIALQNAISKLINLAKPKNVLELGSALGTTTLRLANENPAVQFIGQDMRSDIIEQANKNIESLGIKNVSFAVKDMNTLTKSDLASIDFIFLLYSFHHIEDPISKKEVFLKNLYNNINQDTYLCIAETFLPEAGESIFSTDQAIDNLWDIRSKEGSYSTFWASLTALDNQSINLAQEVGTFCGQKESEAGDLVRQRKDEYLVKMSWLKSALINSGFKIILEQPVNNFNDRVILVRK